MEYYKEYPIRCKTCNEQLACFAKDYEEYIQAGHTPQEALDELGIELRCSRIAMVSPTIVCFNMENREVIEGFKSVDAAEQANIFFENSSQPVFSSCLNASLFPDNNLTRQPAPAKSLSTLRTISAMKPPQPIPTKSNTPLRTLSSVKPISPVKPTASNVKPRVKLTLANISTKENTMVSGDVVSDPNLSDQASFGEGIAVSAPENTPFTEPIQVGIPTINHDPSLPLPVVSVGAKKQVKILNGRTYLAR